MAVGNFPGVLIGFHHQLIGRIDSVGGWNKVQPTIILPFSLHPPYILFFKFKILGIYLNQIRRTFRYTDW